MGERKQKWIYENEELVEQVIQLVKRVRPFFFNQGMSAHIREKGVADFVTEVDMRVQEIIKGELERIAPGVQFMGEEKDNGEIDFSGDFWILDPVDGTTNLIHDYRQSAVSLALCEAGQVTLGIVYQPYTEELFLAKKGMGAWLNGTPIHVSSAKKLEESLVSVGTSPYRKELAKENFKNFYQIFMRCEDIRRGGSAAIDLAWVACGRTDAYVERNLKPWDYAAGMLLVEEAGGRVTGFQGEAVGVRAPSDIVGGNGTIGQLLVEEILQ